MAAEIDLTSTPIPHARYELSETEVKELEEQLQQRYRHFLAHAREQRLSSVCIAFDGNDPIANLGRVLEQQVFNAEAGDHSVEFMHSEYGAYEDRSLFFLAIDVASGSINGCLRTITGTAGYGPMVKSMRDCLEIDSYRDLGVPGYMDEIDLRDSYDDPLVGLVGRHRNTTGHRLDRAFLEGYHAMEPGDGIFDMATIVVPRHIRAEDSMRISLMIYACSWRAANLLRITHAVTFIKTDLLQVFRDVLGMGWDDLAGLGGTQYVEGDPFLSQPAYLRCDQLRQTFARESRHRDIGKALKAGPPFDRFLDVMSSNHLDKSFLLT